MESAPIGMLIIEHVEVAIEFDERDTGFLEQRLPFNFPRRTRLVHR
jgi:hypothetical protein